MPGVFVLRRGPVRDKQRVSVSSDIAQTSKTEKILIVWRYLSVETVIAHTSFLISSSGVRELPMGSAHR